MPGPLSLPRQDANVQELVERGRTTTKTSSAKSVRWITSADRTTDSAEDVDEDWGLLSDGSTCHSFTALDDYGGQLPPLRPSPTTRCNPRAPTRKSSVQAWLSALQEEDKWAAGPSSKKPQKKMPPPEIPKSSPPKPKPEQLRDLRVGIIGAGFTGLLLAHGLRRHGGIEVDI